LFFPEYTHFIGTSFLLQKAIFTFICRMSFMFILIFTSKLYLFGKFFA
jgi:hypothetical protein